jgi:hypothetical protein
MAKSKTELSEKRINQIISARINGDDKICISQLRLASGEFDIVFLDKNSLRITNIEIKKNNWRHLLDQSIKRKLYCHYSIAVLPEKYKEKIPFREFEKNGIGLAFYKEFGEELLLEMNLAPSLSSEINRYFKQILYKQFLSRCGELIYV